MAVDNFPKLAPPASRKKREQVAQQQPLGGSADAAFGGNNFPRAPSGPSSPSNGFQPAPSSTSKNDFDSLLDLDFNGGFGGSGGVAAAAGPQPNYGALSGFSMTGSYNQSPGGYNQPTAQMMQQQQQQQQQQSFQQQGAGRGMQPPQALYTNPASNPFASPTSAFPPHGGVGMQSPAGGPMNPFGMTTNGHQSNNMSTGFGNVQAAPNMASPMGQQPVGSGFDADFGSVFGNSQTSNPFGSTQQKANATGTISAAGQTAQSKLIQNNVETSLANLAANLNLGSLGAYGVRPQNVSGSPFQQAMAGPPANATFGMGAGGSGQRVPMASSTMNPVNNFSGQQQQQQQQGHFGGMNAAPTGGWNPFMSPSSGPQASPARPATAVTAASDDPFASLI